VKFASLSWKNNQRRNFAAITGILAGGITLFTISLGAQSQSKPNSAAANSSTSAANAASSPILKAMSEELERSKSQLQMEGIAKPYYIEYRVSDVDEYVASASFGAIEQRARVQLRIVRAVVRIGDYKQDSYIGQGLGAVEPMPMDADLLGLRKAIWLATDRAYKAAGEALAQKQAMLKQFTAPQEVDDFSKADPIQKFDPRAELQFDAQKTEHMLAAATAIYKDDPDLQTLGANVQFSAINDYFVNTEGTTTSHGQTLYYVGLTGSTQAADGMRLERSPYTQSVNASEVPSEQKLISDSREMLATLKALRAAPVVEEEYRGPVLLAPDASADVVATLIGANVLGRKPAPGRNGRTLGEFASMYKTRVLPAFVTVVDDPTEHEFNHQLLTGSYDFDDEGVKAAPVTVIDKGQLINYLTTREPILDFPVSNGHGRATAGGPPMAHYGVLELESSEAQTPDALKQKLIQMCRDEGKEYGYRIDTLGGLSNPRLLYRVWVKDGHEELVRGAQLGELDLRGLRNDLVAVGSDEAASNRSGGVPETVISPSLLFDELELRRDDRAKAKLPEYPAPPSPAGTMKAGTSGSSQK
jgi:TldD protein